MKVEVMAGLENLFSFLGFGQLRPCFTPRMREHLLTTDCAICVLLNQSGTSGCNRAIAASHLRQKGRTDTQGRGQLGTVSASAFDVTFKVHMLTRFCESLTLIAKVASVKVLL